MGKKNSQCDFKKRAKGKDKKKNTFKKFGKNTTRGVRFAEKQKANTIQNKIKETEKSTNKEKKKEKYLRNKHKKK